MKSTEEIEKEANLKWLWRHHVADAATRQEVKRKFAKNALKKLTALVNAFGKLDLLDDLWIDGSHMRLSPQSQEEWRRTWARLQAIENHIKRFLP